MEAMQRGEVTGLLYARGYNVYRPEFDEGVDFIAHNMDTGDLKLIQQKSGWTIDKKYLNREIWIAFRERDRAGAASAWYLAPHDWMCEIAETHENVLNTVSWRQSGKYTRRKIPERLREVYAPHMLTHPELER